MMLLFQEDATQWKKKLADKQEDQQAAVHEQHDTTLREVLAQVEPVDLVCLLTWFFSTTINPGAALAHSVAQVLAVAMHPRAEAFAENTTPRLESSHAPLSMASPVSRSSPALQVHTLSSLVLRMSNIEASGTPVRYSSLTLVIGIKPKKCDHSSNSASDDQCDKRAYIGIKKEPINDISHGTNVNARSALLIARCDTAPIKGGREQEPLINIRDAKSDRHDPHSQRQQH